MRKGQANYSPKAKKVLEMLEMIDLGRDPRFIYQNNDVSWSLAEAVTVETPVGEVHLHWTNRRGQGNWKIIVNPQWRGEICGTARCRRVIITPLGGANEVAPIKIKTLEQLGEEHWRAKWEKDYPDEPYPFPTEDERYLGERVT